MRTLVIATRNTHKIQEIRAILGDGFRYLGLRDLPGAPHADETGTTFAANARLKALAIARWLLDARTSSGTPVLPLESPASGHGPTAVLADDSGLEVDALDGAPGVHSARFASDDFGIQGNSPDGANNAKLLRRLAEVPEDRRGARFRCALAWVDVVPGLPVHDFDGACEGRIGWLQRGAMGFGYDPLFIPIGHDRTFAELGEATKNEISHRSRALASLVAWIRDGHGK